MKDINKKSIKKVSKKANKRKQGNKKKISKKVIIGGLIIVTILTSVIVIKNRVSNKEILIAEETKKEEELKYDKEMYFMLQETGILDFDDMEGTVTREDFANILLRIYNRKNPNSNSEIGDIQFTDTTSRNIREAAYFGLVKGYDDGKFNPNKEIEREEAAVIFVNALENMGYKIEDSIKDVELKDVNKVSKWAVDSVKKSVATGAMSTKNGNFSPNEKIKNYELVKYIEVFLFILSNN